MEQKITGVESMQHYAAEFVGALVRKERAVVVALRGDLGAGKTTFVQGAARALGIAEPITSPTFVIQKAYQLSGQTFARLVHIDAYRLGGAHELEALAWKETLVDPNSLIFLEWPERVQGAVPADAALLHLRFIDESTRGVERKQA